MTRTLRLLLPGLLCATFGLCWSLSVRAAGDEIDNVTIHVTAKPVETFIPEHAFGAGLDGSDAGTAAKVFRPQNIVAMHSIGFRALTYRLRTELAIEAWHWNPQGAWSEAGRQRGYWTSAASASSGPIDVGWGYRLPRRGSTIDQANNDGYSRVDDGDPRTFWKSDPYLDPHFTHEPSDRHPQWVVVDLGASRPIDTVRLHWGIPYARQYRIDYAVFPPGTVVSDSESAFEPDITWHTFPAGRVADGRGGDITLHVCPAKPTTARFVRIWMTRSSEAAPPGSRDIRDRMGYALGELLVGHQTGRRFIDWVKHAKADDQQSVVYASSTDPWHTSTDRDPHVEQPGFDRIVSSGLMNGQPMLTPVSILYDTPDNAVAELRYLRARHIPVTQIELGEEPDGQYVTPEDYGALYVQWADALHRVDPTVRLGGPSFQTAVEGWVHWTDEHGDYSWMRRFLAYLKAHGHRSDFNFFSFEWYPFDEIDQPAPGEIAKHATLLDTSLSRLCAEGLPRDIPWIISEYGYSPFATQDEVTLAGALVNAETVARFLTLGGDQAFLYGYEPGSLNIEHSRDGATWGNLLAFLADEEGNARYRLPAYWTARLIAGCWADGNASAQPHELYRATVSRPDGTEDPLVAAYPIRRPDGTWAVMLLNKDASHQRTVHISFEVNGSNHPMAGAMNVWRFGAEQYAWKADGEHGHPVRSLPPSHQTVNAATGEGADITLSAFSLGVVQGSE